MAGKAQDAASTLVLNDWITALLDTVQGVDAWLRILLAGIAIMLETSVMLGLIVPGDTVVLVAATATEDLPQGLMLALACILGALCGESIGFLIGKLLGPWIDRTLKGRWPRVAAQWEKFETYLRRRGGFAIFLSRFLPVAHSLVPLIVGASGFAYRRFIAWTAPACTLWAALYVSVGALAAGSFRELADTVHNAGYFFVGAIVLFLVLVALTKRWILRREARHMQDES